MSQACYLVKEHSRQLTQASRTGGSIQIGEVQSADRKFHYCHHYGAPLTLRVLLFVSHLGIRLLDAIV